MRLYSTANERRLDRNRLFVCLAAKCRRDARDPAVAPAFQDRRHFRNAGILPGFLLIRRRNAYDLSGSLVPQRIIKYIITKQIFYIIKKYQEIFVIVVIRNLYYESVEACCSKIRQANINATAKHRLHFFKK
ncbi:MAG: hypothetical protein LBP59_16050 [Planctomycetaceae bacterium]|nr:hypothetical protein [Planctomycetaceae bacterium]